MLTNNGLIPEQHLDRPDEDVRADVWARLWQDRPLARSSGAPLNWKCIMPKSFCWGM